jgi:beta-phosphoglucomutase
MIDAVLLEWEGILADTAGSRRESLLHALAEEGMPVDPIAYHTLCDGRTVHEAAANMLAHSGRRDPTLVDLVALRAERAFSEKLGKGFMLLPGAREFVERLQLRTRVAVVSSASRAETDFVLQLAGIADAISTIVVASDVANAPPAPDVYTRAIEQLGRARPVKNDRVIALATTAFALRAARAAGTKAVAVGAEAHVAVEAIGAVALIDGLSVTELARLANINLREQKA